MELNGKPSHGKSEMETHDPLQGMSPRTTWASGTRSTYEGGREAQQNRTCTGDFKGQLAEEMEDNSPA